MDRLSQPPDVSPLGLDPESVTDFDLISAEHDHRVWRLRCDEGAFILKCASGPDAAKESACYRLLDRLGVPLLPVRSMTQDMLLLEDLRTHATWRLAEEPDVRHAETGLAVAAWYHRLHDAGRELLAGPGGAPDFLERETDLLSPSSVRETGVDLGIQDEPGWTIAERHLERMLAAYNALPKTLCYCDFHWSNLALTRNASKPRRAVVFDYHLLGIGPPFADFRNVLSCLVDDAQSSFREAFGPVNRNAATLDAPLAVLVALTVAAARPALPRWAQGLLEQVRDGTLQQMVRRATELI